MIPGERDELVLDKGGLKRRARASKRSGMLCHATRMPCKVMLVVSSMLCHATRLACKVMLWMKRLAARSKL